MSKYIDADKLIDYFDDAVINETFDAIMTIRDYLSESDAGVVEVKHGEWKEGKNRQQCSECLYRGFKSYNFCPNCGADMRGDECGL